MTTHVLDTAAGSPAAGLEVTLHRQLAGGEWERVGAGETDRDGRLSTLPSVEDGLHRLDFLTPSTFFPQVSVTFRVTGEEHLHVPLLLSPYGYTTYRGS